MTAGKAITLTIWTFVDNVMALLFNMLSKLVIAFFFPGKLSFNFMAVVTVCSDFGAQENKAGHCFQSHPFFCHEVMGLDTIIITFFNVELINLLVD